MTAAEVEVKQATNDTPAPDPVAEYFSVYSQSRSTFMMHHSGSDGMTDQSYIDQDTQIALTLTGTANQSGSLPNLTSEPHDNDSQGISTETKADLLVANTKAVLLVADIKADLLVEPAADSSRASSDLFLRRAESEYEPGVTDAPAREVMATWDCTVCTFVNPLLAVTCVMCPSRAVAPATAKCSRGHGLTLKKGGKGKCDGDCGTNPSPSDDVMGCVSDCNWYLCMACAKKRGAIGAAEPSTNVSLASLFQPNDKAAGRFLFSPCFVERKGQEVVSGRLVGFSAASMNAFGDSMGLPPDHCRVQLLGGQDTVLVDVPAASVKLAKVAKERELGRLMLTREVALDSVLSLMANPAPPMPNDFTGGWTCTTCKAANNAKASKCRACSGKQVRWTCAGCTTSNRASIWYCKACKVIKTDATADAPSDAATLAATTPALAAAFQVGDKVKSQFKRPGGTQYAAIITNALPDGTFDVLYNDGLKDSQVSVDRMTLVERGGSPAFALVAAPGRQVSLFLELLGASMNLESNFSKIDLQSKVALSTAASKSRFRVGDKVTANYKGRSNNTYPAIITACNPDGTYAILYPQDNDSESNALEQHLTPEGGVAASAPAASTLNLLEDASSDDDDEEKLVQVDKQDNFEVQLNTQRLEDEAWGGNSMVDRSVPKAVAEHSDLTPPLQRQLSKAFRSLNHFKPLKTLRELLTFADKLGNTAAHHVLRCGLRHAGETLLRLGASPWTANQTHDTPAGLARGIPMGSGHRLNQLFQAVAKRDLLPPPLVPAALATPSPYVRPEVLSVTLQAIVDRDEKKASGLLRQMNESKEKQLHGKVYHAFFRLSFGYGPSAALQDVQDYLQDLTSAVDLREYVVVDPLLYYVYYLLWTQTPGQRHIRRHRLAAADALRACRAFPEFADAFLHANDNEDARVLHEGLDTAQGSTEDDDYAELLPPSGPNDPETTWADAKRQHGLSSPAMDRLMGLVGLRQVKVTAVAVILSVLLTPPADLDSTTATNFMFVGNPGTGKTTVAQLMAEAMNQVGFRKNPVPVSTTTTDILSDQKPEECVKKLIQDAVGGTLVMDDFHTLAPAPRGQRANDSNKILDHLRKAVDVHKKTTTFTLAGYEEEMQIILAQDPGLSGRFPITFRFEDYRELQLTKILSDMTRARKYAFESQRQCGVPIARVLARRLQRHANTKGFKNAHECKAVLEQCIRTQQARLLRLKLDGKGLSDLDYRLLTREDTLGPRPSLAENEDYQTLMKMHGLKAVKRAVTELLTLQLQNYEAELRGERVQQVSLHRVFLGSPGTGKTTVATLLGKILNAFGFLSDGGFVRKTPSDLMGSAVGEAAARTNALLQACRGKVLLLDEAYILDPTRGVNGGSYGGSVIDTIVEKMEEAGPDLCVILAGYRPQMNDLFQHTNNDGFRRRFNMAQAFEFEDFSDDDLRHVLKQLIAVEDLSIEPDVLDFAVIELSKQRIHDDFGNAGAAKELLSKAKLRLSTRRSVDNLSRSQLKLLINSDFAGDESSGEKAREAFGGLEYCEHIHKLIEQFEASILEATQEGKNPQSVVAEMHMIFHGPPGTGKTTAAKRFALMFKRLGMLPREDCTYVTATELMGQYVGASEAKTRDALRRAKGGILFIDEAYRLVSDRSTYGSQVLQVLLDSVTAPDFQGKVVVILAGYLHDLEKLFGVNPGFQSRFDKKRVEFKCWSAQQACTAVCNAITRDGRAITESAEVELKAGFEAMRALPNWASARDAFDIIYKSLKEKRALRWSQLFKERRSQSASSADAKFLQPIDVPYIEEDVQQVFATVLANRGANRANRIRTVENHAGFLELTTGASSRIVVVCFTQSWCGACRVFKPQFAGQANDPQFADVVFAEVPSVEVASRYRVESFPTTRVYRNSIQVAEIIGADESGLQQALHEEMVRASGGPRFPMQPSLMDASGSAAHAPQPLAPKNNFKQKVIERKEYKKAGGGDDDMDEEMLWQAFETACSRLGLTLEAVVKMLEATPFPPDAVLSEIMAATGYSDAGKVAEVLERKRSQTAQRMKQALQLLLKTKSEEEKRVQAALKRMGKCVMGFEWIREQNGWRCAGGSHFMAHDEVANAVTGNM